MPTRRDFLKYGVAAIWVAAGIATPVTARLTSRGIAISPADALARNGGGGGGSGGGSGGGNGGNGGGSGGGSGGGQGNGNGGGQGNGKGAGKGNAAKGAASSRPDMTVQHRNGIREGVSKGRYTMQDSRGRVIVNRPATPLDYLRVLR